MLDAERLRSTCLYAPSCSLGESCVWGRLGVSELPPWSIGVHGALPKEFTYPKCPSSVHDGLFQSMRLAILRAYDTFIMHQARVWATDGRGVVNT